MKDVYILKNGMTKEQMFRLSLMNGFNIFKFFLESIDGTSEIVGKVQIPRYFNL